MPGSVERTILVIEDNDQNLYLTTYLLERHGYRVLSARNGSEGIDLARKMHFDLIVLDIQLPLMDGYAVAAELRKDPALEGTPIVAVTSYAMAGDRERVLAAGCTGYIEKPIDPETFVPEVEQYLPPGAGSREARP